MIQTVTTPTITLSCQGNSVKLTSSTANSYLWSTGSTASSIAVINNPKTYSVTVTNTTGCKSTGSAAVEKNTIKIKCKGEFLEFTSSIPAASYVWFNGTTTSSIVVDSINISPQGSVYTLKTSNPVTCTSTDTLYNTYCLFLDLSNASSDVYFSPNPTKGLLNISTRLNFESVTISIINILGEVLYTTKDEKNTPEYNFQINLFGLTRGLYYIRFDTGSFKKTEKIIIDY